MRKIRKKPRRNLELLLLFFPLIVFITVKQCYLITLMNALFVDQSGFHISNNINNIPEINFIFKTPIASSLKGDYRKYVDIKSICNDKVCYQNRVRPKVNGYQRVITRFSSQLTTLWSVFVSFNTGLTFLQGNFMQNEAAKTRRYDRGKVVGFYDELIVIGSGHAYLSWGHSMQDIYNALMHVPWLIGKSHILTGIDPFHLEVCQLLGFRRDQVVQLPFCSWVYASIVHTLNPAPYLSCYSVGMLRLQAAFVKAYHLDDIEPTIYGYSNRKAGKPRHVINIEEVVQYANSRLSDVQLEFVPDMYESVEQNAKSFARLKFLFFITGSNLVKSYFMHENTVIVSPASENVDYSVIRSNMVLRVFFIQYLTMMPHWNPKGANISAPVAFYYIKKGLFCAKYQRWPPMNFSEKIQLYNSVNWTLSVVP